MVVTGASAGIGRATVRELAARGARIGLIARGRERLDATAREVEELGGQALVLPLDVADADAVEDAAARTEEAFGPLDAWVNNAMLSVFSPIAELTAAEVRRVTEVTYLWESVAGPWAAHGRFDDRASERSLQLAAATHRRPLVAVAALAALGGLVLRARRNG